jgi:hypothetical protein
MTNQDETPGATGSAGAGSASAGSRGPDPDVAREEAERLVAAGLAAVSMVADRIGAPTRERGGAAAAGYDALGDMLFGPSGHRRHTVANDSPECCRCPVCRVIAAAREPSPRVAERLATGVGSLADGAARVMRGLADATGYQPPDTTTTPRTAAIFRDAPEPDPWAAATAQAAPAKKVTRKAVKKAIPETVVAERAGAKKAGAKKAVAKKAVKKAAPDQTAPQKATDE